METLTKLRVPFAENIGMPTDRSPQARRLSGFLGDIRAVSADSHWEVTEDIFFENFPAHLKEDAPRVWHDRYWRIGYPGRMESFAIGDNAPRIMAKGLGRGGWNMEQRRTELEVEGIWQEIVYPQSLLGFVRYPNFEVQEWLYRIYNDYMAGLSAANPGFNAVGIFSNWWDPKRAEAAMRQIVDLGFKSFMVPVTAGRNLDGKNMSYGGVEMDTFWNLADEAGLPVAFHIGENTDVENRGGLGAGIMAAIGVFRKPLGQIIFGGVFDRHPSVNVVFAEGGISWVPVALQDAEFIYDSFTEMVDPIERRPSEYWQTNCFATFQSDALGLNQLDYIGAERIMWASDYPHPESTFGYNWDAMKAVADAVSPENAEKILGGTARKLYGLD